MRDLIQKYVKLWHVNVVVLIAVLQMIHANWDTIDDYLSPQVGKALDSVIQVIITILSIFGI